MTRDEAIEKAMDLAKEELHVGNDVRLHLGHNLISVIRSERMETVLKIFEYDPPRRIPQKGTPVMTPDRMRTYFSQGEYTSCGLLVRAHWEGRRLDAYLKNWIELAEVQK